MISKTKERGVTTFEEVYQSGNKESEDFLGLAEKRIQFDDPVNIQYTSGTTGYAKGSVLSHFNIVNNAIVSGRRLGYHLEKPIICCQVPLFHCFGSVLGTLTSVSFQGTCIFPNALFTPIDSLKSIEEHKCTVIYGTPTMYVDILNVFKTQTFDVSSLKQAVFGGSFTPVQLARDIQESFKLSYITNAYGSTENSPVVAMNAKEDGLQCAFDMKARAVEFLEIKVVDSEDRIVPVNTRGELCVRGHNVFLGYWDEASKTDEVVDKAKWYHTGDLAVMDEKEFVKIVGRKKDMVIRGGENIFPTEIENLLSANPEIAEAHVVGVPDSRMGEELCAWISISGGSNLTENKVKEYCKGKISHFKIPRYVLIVEEFPKTMSGKIKKFEMVKISIEKLNL